MHVLYMFYSYAIQYSTEHTCCLTICTYLYIAEEESATTNQVFPTLLVYPLGILGGVSGVLLVALAVSVCIIVVLLRKGKYNY